MVGINENRKVQSPEWGGGHPSPKKLSPGDRMSPLRKSIKISGMAKDNFEALEVQLRQRLGRKPTHDEIVQYLFENQIKPIDALHQQLRDVEKFIRINFSSEDYALATYLFALIRQCALKNKDPEVLRVTIEKALNGTGGEKK
jgi:hypothetical protein